MIETIIHYFFHTNESNHAIQYLGHDGGDPAPAGYHIAVSGQRSQARDQLGLSAASSNCLVCSGVAGG